jgi:deoxyhypusine synthase
MESYGPIIEEKMQLFLEEKYKNSIREMSTSKIYKTVGKHLWKNLFFIELTKMKSM